MKQKTFKTQEAKNSYAATITQGIQPYFEGLDTVNIPSEFEPTAGSISELTDDDFDLSKVSALTRKRYFTLKYNDFTCVCCKRRATKYLRLKLSHSRYLYGFYFTQYGKKYFLNIDHKTPIAIGGANGKQNTQAMCFCCNAFKSDSISKKDVEHQVHNTEIPWSGVSLGTYTEMSWFNKIKFHIKQALWMIVRIPVLWRMKI